MSTIATPDRFTTLPDESVIASAVTALEEHGFSVEVVDDLDAARQAVLARIPPGSSVMTNTSVTLDQAGIAVRDQRRRALRFGAQPDVRARLRNPGARDEGDRRPAGLRPRRRARGHPRRNPRHRLRLRAASSPPTPGARPTSSSSSARRSSSPPWRPRTSVLPPEKLTRLKPHGEQGSNGPGFRPPAVCAVPHHHLRSRARSVPLVWSSASSSAMSSSDKVKSKICAFSWIRSRWVDLVMNGRPRCRHQRSST